MQQNGKFSGHGDNGAAARCTGPVRPAQPDPGRRGDRQRHRPLSAPSPDGAHDTRKCHDAIADRCAHAVIPPRKNAKPWKTVTAGAVARNGALRAAKYLGRAIWRNWSGYHRRSRAETKMHCMKLLGQRLMARDFDRQVAEVQIRIAVMNGYTALGIPVTETVGRIRPGKGEPRTSEALCNRAAGGCMAGRMPYRLTSGNFLELLGSVSALASGPSSRRRQSGHGRRLIDCSERRESPRRGPR